MKRLLLLSTVLLCSSIAMADTKLDIAVTVGEKHLQKVVLLHENEGATIVQDGLTCKVSAQEDGSGANVTIDIYQETDAGQVWVADFPLLLPWGKQASFNNHNEENDLHVSVVVTASQS